MNAIYLDIHIMLECGYENATQNFNKHTDSLELHSSYMQFRYSSFTQINEYD